MKELWVKKSVYRRYLIKDEDIKEAKGILDYEPDRIDLIDNDLDLNSEIEYDDEKLYFPVTYNIEDLSKMNIVDKKDLMFDINHMNDNPIMYGYSDTTGKQPFYDGILTTSSIAYPPSINSALYVSDVDKEIFRIETNGDIFLRGKKIGSDKRVAEILNNAFNTGQFNKTIDDEDI